MSNDSKRISELDIATTVSANDRVVVLTNPSTSPNVYTISAVNFAKSLSANIFPIANSTTLGVIKIGPGLAIAANGVVSAPLPIANTSSFGVVKVGNNLSINATGYLSTTNTGSWTFDGTRANTGGSQNSWIDGQSPGGLWLHNDYTVTLTSSDNSANSTYGYGYISNNESGLYNQLNTTNTWSWLGTNISDSEEPYVFIENTRNAGANNQITNRWIFDLHGNFSLPANSTVGSEGGFHIENATTISADVITIHNNIFDDLNRPLINVNALDINADGGTPATVFGPSDTIFDGGAVTTVFGQYEAALDGGVSFNNRHSATFIDGGGAANQF